MKIFDKTYDNLVKAMDMNYRRHTVLTSNVANSETPNYRARDLDFYGVLERAVGQAKPELRTSDPRHYSGDESSESPRIVYDYTTALGGDGNNVDLDKAMGKISENSESYQEAINYVSIKLRMLRASVSRGGSF